MERQKRAAAIHDISGLGRCSLTVILPILSAAGIETGVLPTAFLSTHTGGLPGYTCRDLTSELLPAARHWKSLGLHFDALYSGFLGSFEQISIVSEIFRMLKSDDTLVLVDPVFADHGKLYATCTPQMADGMRDLCQNADIIVPNLTEASYLLGREYREGQYNRREVEEMLRSLTRLGPKSAVITGVSFEPGRLGAAGYDSASGEFCCSLFPRVDGSYPGTGAIFASVLLGARLNGDPLSKAVDAAVQFTGDAIQRTWLAKTDPRFGVNFEYGLASLPSLLKSGENGSY